MTKNPVKRIIIYWRSVKEVRLSRSAAGTFGIFLLLIFISFLMALPFYLAVVNSLKPIEEFFYWPPRFYVINPTFRNYSIILKIVDNWMVPFSRFFLNSILVTLAGTAAALIIGCMAGYALAKGKAPGLNILSAVVVGALLFHNNGALEFFQYIMMSWFRMIDTYWAVIIPGICGTLYVFLIKQFIIGTLQDEVIEAARIDGAGEYRILFNIVIPVIKPAIMTAVVYAFPSFWNSAGKGIYTENVRTLASVLAQIGLGGTARQGPAAAVAVMMMVPGLIVFIYSQRSIMKTMGYSGIK